MKNDDNDSPATADEILQSVETTLDAVAEEHESHDCGTTDLALRLSAGVRLKREALGGASKSGPAQVATKQYRNNYDAIFMSKGGSA